MVGGLPRADVTGGLLEADDAGLDAREDAGLADAEEAGLDVFTGSTDGFRARARVARVVARAAAGRRTGRVTGAGAGRCFA